MSEELPASVRELLDLGSAADILKKIERGAIRVTTLDSAKPSPFASALLFSYIANYIYEGDAPLAERRVQALSMGLSRFGGSYLHVSPGLGTSKFAPFRFLCRPEATYLDLVPRPA